MIKALALVSYTQGSKSSSSVTLEIDHMIPDE
jgi:hypothetical protein